MAVMILALGSRGDVQPMVSLARALVRRGTEVAIAALDDYAGLVTDAGARHVSFGTRLDSMTELALGPVGQAAMRTEWFQPVLIGRWARTFADRLGDAVMDALHPGDSLLTGLLTRDVAGALAQARGTRVATVLYTATLPTRHPESHLFGYSFPTSSHPLVRAEERARVRLIWRLSSSMGQVGRPLRRRLGLRPLSAAALTREVDRHPILLCQSPLLVPPADDWPATVVQTGYPDEPAPADFVPPPNLADFLEAGPPPVYVGWGSMHEFSGEMAEQLLSITRATGRRLVTAVVPGQSPGPVSDDAFAVGSMPHAWLFPRMAGIVHHGGAGTTVAALRSGRPSAITPAMFDQPYHARRCAALGVGPLGFPIRSFSSGRAATLVGELLDGPRAASYAAAATVVAEKLKGEDGVALTIRALDRLGLS